MAEVGNSVPFALYNTNTGLVNLIGDEIRAERIITNQLFSVDGGDIEVDTIAIDGQLKLFEPTVTNFNALKANPALASDITWCLPTADGGPSTALITDGAGNLSFSSVSTADVVQSSSPWGFDNRVLRTDGTSRNIERTGLSIDDFDSLSGINGLSANGSAQILLQTSFATIDAIRLNATGIAGSIDIDASNINIESSGTSETSILINSASGGIDIEAIATKDIEIDGGQVKIKNKDNTAKAIEIITNQGGSETIEIINTQGTSASGILLQSLAGGIKLESNVASAEAILITTAGSTMATLKLESGSLVNVDVNGVLFDTSQGVSNIDSLTTSGATGQLFLQTNLAAAGAVTLNASLGGIVISCSDKVDIQSALDTSGDAIELRATLGGIILTSNLASADSIKLSPSNASGGVLIESGLSSQVDINGVFINTTNDITAVNTLELEERAAGSDSIKLQAPDVVTTSYTIELPGTQGVAGQILFASAIATEVMLTEWVNPILPAGYIHGFNLQYSSATSVDLGTASVESVCKAFNSTTKSFSFTGIQNVSITTAGAGGLSTTYTESADQGYDVYVIGDSTLVNSDDFLIIEADDDITTVAEFVSDFDLFRRLGFFYNDGSSDILLFVTQGLGSDRSYHYNTDRDDVEVLDDGNSATFVDVNCSSFMGLDSRLVILRAVFGDINGTTVDNSTLALRTNGSTMIIEQTLVTLSPGSGMGIGDLHDAQVEIMTDSGQIIEYALTTSGDSAFLYILGFRYSL